ncbi:MAG: carboxyvinyl-carboxyphosphonate phosphorylmutase [Rhodospirillaceae bacterium]|nr:carboxyvinyl-carboxyphosphonate phosphorylmutase [Rhodospirillaceae bacterium]|tara:strand:+ start:99 stop:995 length:897 start_codon:yes stop_codon:yes gene_type:complete
MANNMRKEYKAMLEAPELLVMPGVFDGFSTAIVEKMGFRAGFVSGAGISESALGLADFGVMGLEDNLNRARALVDISGIPLQADADTGYGNAVNVYHTIRAFEKAGLVGAMIEDQVWPKRCGHMKGKDVIPFEEAVSKIKAAADARVDSDFVIMSRTDTFAVHGLDDVIERLNAFAEAGADLIFADALLSEEDIIKVVENTSKPLCVNMGFGLRTRSTTPLISAKRLEAIGVGAVIYPRLLTGAAIVGMTRALEGLQTAMASEEVIEKPELVASFEDILDLTKFEFLTGLEKKYATGD